MSFKNFVWIIAVFSHTAWSMNASEFGARRLPFELALIENHEPRLCAEILGVARQLFRGDRLQPQITSQDLSAVRWIKRNEAAIPALPEGPLYSI